MTISSYMYIRHFDHIHPSLSFNPLTHSDIIPLLSEAPFYYCVYMHVNMHVCTLSELH